MCRDVDRYRKVSMKTYRNQLKTNNCLRKLCETNNLYEKTKSCLVKPILPMKKPRFA